MSQLAAQVVITVVGIYLLVGVVFALPFAASGAARIDPRARGVSIGFRLLIIPGTAALWPLLAWRWLRGWQPPEERNPHRPPAPPERRP